MMPSLDEIGEWSETKLTIIREYAKPYSQILAGNRLYHLYIDGFAGAGMHISRRTKAIVAGSPLNVMAVEPRFREYHLVELDFAKVAHLRSRFGRLPDVRIYHGDCNDIIPSQIFGQVQWRDRRRALCLLDPYGLHLDWSVVRGAGQLRTIDLLLNFPVMDMNRNVLWHDPGP